MIVDLFKRNSVLAVFFPLYLLVVALALVELDKQHYQSAKKDLIINNGEFYLAVPKDVENRLEKAAERALSPGATAADLRQLNDTILEIIFDDTNPFYRIVVKKTSQSLNQSEVLMDLENVPKFKSRNVFANSLILPGFSRTGSKPVNLETDPNVVLGQISREFTNPDPGDPATHELTITYRWYALFLVIVLTVLAGVIAGGLLFPLNKVLNSLEGSTPQRTVFCRQPRGRLESLYNRMALGAVVSRLQSELRDEIARNPQLTGWEVVEFTMRRFREQTDLPFVAALEFVARGPGNITPTGRRVVVSSITGDSTGLAAMLDEALPRDGRVEASIRLEPGDNPLEGEMLLLADPDRTGFRYLFAIAQPAGGDERVEQTQHAMILALAELADVGLQSLSQRNQLVVKERGRANISLSRNLGHDLTNIIATSKLELMALDRVLSKGELPQDERRRGILRESLQGLLKSIRFMQETVNLYRSYAFLQHPVLEIQDGNTLLSETLDLFALSVSAKIELRRELAEDAPRCVVDPRLIKLALFNMFSNSLKAIRKASPDQASGWLKAITRRSVDGGLCIAIEDSGTGIVDSAGNKLATHEIEKIFELGYSSRENQDEAGEGLGLNWVRTIIQDLHGGSIHAENTQTHGARFVIVFPPIEQAPDMENAERKAADYLKQFQRQRETREARDAGA